MDVSVIIPIYNETANIDLLYNRLKKVMVDLNVSHELIFINDGSTDNSLALIKELHQSDGTVKFINLSRNFGHQIAVTAGIDKANGKAIAIIDADLQDPPELLIEMYEKLQAGNQVVYAKRASRKVEPFFKRIATRIFYRILAKLTNIDIPLDTGDFRIMDRKVADILKEMPEQDKYLRGQIAWIGMKQTYVTYDREDRHAGESGYTVSKLFKLALDGITSFSDFPLRFATFMGFFVSGITFILMIFTIISKYILEAGAPQGWASQMMSILFIGGIQLIAIGIIGEYISRMSKNIRKRPLYVIESSNLDKPEQDL